MPPETKPLAIEDIPMPPDDPDFEEQENASQGQVEDGSQNTVDAVEPSSSLPIADLDFTDDDCVSVPLKRPFKRDGVKVTAFVCKPLTFGMVQDLTRKAAREDGIEIVEVYAAIAQTDVATLRGLREEDGNKVTETARDFLPLVFHGTPPSG